MILSSRSLPEEPALSAAICIIGAGAAGITLACELDGTDLAVTLLEAAGIGWGAGCPRTPTRAAP